MLLAGAASPLGRPIADALAAMFDVSTHLRLDGDGTVDAVVHCATQTAFNARPTRLHHDNLVVTRRLLDLADRHEAPLVLVSTYATVAASFAHLPRRLGGLRRSLESRRAAEDLVAGSGQPTLILRTNETIGDARYPLPADQMAYLLMAHIARGSLRPRRGRVDALTTSSTGSLIAAVIAATVLDPPAGTRILSCGAGPAAVDAADLFGVAERLRGTPAVTAAAPAVIEAMVDLLVDQPPIPDCWHAAGTVPPPPSLLLGGVEAEMRRILQDSATSRPAEDVTR